MNKTYLPAEQREELSQAIDVMFHGIAHRIKQNHDENHAEALNDEIAHQIAAALIFSEIQDHGIQEYNNELIKFYNDVWTIHFKRK